MDNSAKLDKWNAVKKSVDKKKFKQKIEIQRIYWVSIGQNVGSEVYGKGKDFARPVLVVKVFFNDTFLGVPLTSKAKNKTGRLYYKFIDSKNRLQVALLGQIRIFDIKRVANYISKVERAILKRQGKKFKKRLYKNTPAQRRGNLPLRASRFLSLLKDENEQILA